MLFCKSPRIDTIKKRADFLRLNSNNKKCACRHVVLLCAAQPEALTPPTMRVGFTVTKKIGHAVIRNRAKRRLREVARTHLPTLGNATFDYVFIAKHSTATCDFAELSQDVSYALARLHKEA